MWKIRGQKWWRQVLKVMLELKFDYQLTETRVEISDLIVAMYLNRG